MSDIKVSVIIATYRRKNELIRALESLYCQSYFNIEIIVVDDNDDNDWNELVGKIVDDFKEKNSSIQLIYIQNHPNLGSAKTRNVGIEIATGDYVTFLDDDDIYLPDKIKRQVDQMIEKNADYSLMNLALYNEDETLCEIRKRDYLIGKEDNDLLLCHLKYHMTGTDTMMFRRKYLNDIGGFEPIDVGDEFYLMMKSIERKGVFVYVDSNDVKAYVHQGEGGLSSGQGKINGENRLYKYKKSFFKSISAKDKRYIIMRHYAVLAFAYKRSGKVVRFILSGIKSFIVAPFQCVKLIKNLK